MDVSAQGVFDDDAKFLAEVKSGLVVARELDPDFELKNLKERFEVWKKDFKQRLGDTKVLLKKLGTMDNSKQPAADKKRPSIFSALRGSKK